MADRRTCENLFMTVRGGTPVERSDCALLIQESARKIGLRFKLRVQVVREQENDDAPLEDSRHV